ncbi:hypothetical protein [Hymenobacter cheonanensis]|uniref:hypothetical protein n=1 Tax=Hymenobacter sp. CA2-7 TaxID=3063993 RepID=UPI00272C290F|nr:hypothetical protein [Hymenobacter sp. CA2-7]
MSYLDYIVLFEKCDHAQAFSGNTTRLYLKLLHLANLAGWPVEFAKSDPYIAAVCGFAINTMKDCRAQLVSRELLAITTGGTGRNAATTYRLLNSSKSDAFEQLNPSNFDGLPSAIPSKFDGFTVQDSVNSSKSDAFEQLNPSNFDGLPSAIPSKFDGFTVQDSVNSSKSDAFEQLNPSKNPSNFDTLNIDKEKAGVDAASAATSPLISKKKEAGKKAKKPAALAEQIAALVLPHPSPEFTKLWAEFAAGPKQRKKPVTALRRLLTTLGKYQEGFALKMMERAIAHDWSGLEYDSTPEAYAKWQAEQERRPPAPTPNAPSSYDPAALFGLDSNLTHAQYLARLQQAGQASNH